MREVSNANSVNYFALQKMMILLLKINSGPNYLPENRIAVSGNDTYFYKKIYASQLLMYHLITPVLTMITTAWSQFSGGCEVVFASLLQVSHSA